MDRITKDGWVVIVRNSPDESWWIWGDVQYTRSEAIKQYDIGQGCEPGKQVSGWMRRWRYRNCRNRGEALAVHCQIEVLDCRVREL